MTIADSTYDGEFISHLTDLVVKGELDAEFNRHIEELEPDHMRPFVLRELGKGPFEDQQAVEMLQSEARNRNSELRRLGSWLRWTDIAR